ncbi:hypothetical protein [Kytococcus sp. CUA-901]|uniref:hypothetical protein n=1 Tax=Kytococcus sedentarius TaxID=1276 RepID=UPI000967F51D|nr:hypothetical protein BJF82_05730 [Kytococcus sp. CUA-901]
MRTTLTIEDDVLQAVKDRARARGTTAGQELSALARAALSAPTFVDVGERNGLPVLQHRGEPVTREQVEALLDEEPA